MEKLLLNKNRIVFPISKMSMLVVQPSILLQELTCCDEASVFLIHNTKQYMLSNGICEDTREQMLTLKKHLSMALKNELLWKEEKNIKLPIALAHYHFFIMDKEKAELHGVMFDAENSWAGYKYLLWSKEYTAWMYNDKEGRIILDITSAFHPKHYYNKQGKTRYTEYYDFITTCTSFYTFFISRETALEWLQLAEKHYQSLTNQTNCSR